MFQIPSLLQLKFTSSKGSDQPLLSPNDGKEITRVQQASREDLILLLARLPAASKKMKELKAFEREEFLKKTASLIRRDQEQLARLIATEGGKPLKDARVEAQRAALTFELCAEETTRLGGDVIPMEKTASGAGHLNFTVRDPIGPVLAISAFNHPLNLLAHQVGCALASGNPVVIKPAPATPLSARALEELLLEAGVPPECLFVVNCAIPEIQFLLSSPEFAYVSFIGSAKVGWELRKLIAPGTRLALEHGGQAPAILRADADLELAIAQLLKGAFYHAGQVCISTQRIFVHKSLREKFLAGFVAGAQKLNLGSALEESTDVGPLIRQAEVKRLQEWIKEALDKGAGLLCGNEVQGANQQFLTPTIVVDVPRECRLMQEEAFGPVVSVNDYDDEEELLQYLNSNKYQFEACLYTNDLGRTLYWAKNLMTMTLAVNNHSAYRVDWMPFGGHGLSGLGMGGVRYSMEEMTKLKQIIIRS